MAGNSVSSAMAESEIAVLKETLQAQQQLLQKVYKDLEEEREASASAASEALSMILRLQGEKGAEQMEASQYKRLVEEKMHYAEECLSLFEDLMYTKEMEIASLEFQIQAYRYKLLSLGFSDPCVGKMKFQDRQYFRRNEVQVGELVFNGNVRRNASLPPIPPKDARLKKKRKIRNEGSTASLQELTATKSEELLQVMPEGAEIGDLNSYWEKIKRLDGQVKELSYRRDVERVESDLISSNCDLSSTMTVVPSGLTGISSTCSLTTAVSRDLSLETIARATPIKMDFEGTSSCSTNKVDDSADVLGFEASTSIPCVESETVRSPTPSTTVHDVFEVPQNQDNQKPFVSQKQEQKLIFQGETTTILGKQQSVPTETPEYYYKEKDDWVKKVLLFSHRENKSPEPREGVTLDCHSPLSDPKSLPESEIQLLKKRIELLENDRKVINQESFDRGEEQFKLLKDINEQLKMIQFEIDKFKSKKSSSRDESQFISLIEAMLCCSV